MRFDPTIHHRRSIRIQWYDYCTEGAYFVTICGRGRKPLFGRIHNARMLLNDVGEVVERCWGVIPDHFSGVELDEYVVMPNHIHGILFLTSSEEGAACGAPTEDGPLARPRSLGSIVRLFKSSASKESRLLGLSTLGSVWQRNYYEHVIRDGESLNRIREYILTNPLSWHLDRENPSRHGRDDFDVWLDSFRTRPKIK
jgi:putative transposase